MNTESEKLEMSITWRDQPARGFATLDIGHCESATRHDGLATERLAARIKQLFAAVPSIETPTANVPRQA